MDPTVSVDGAEVPTAALSEPRKLNPGAHTVLAHVSTGPETKTDVTLKEGESQTIEVVVKAPPPPPPLPSASASATVAPTVAPPPPPPPEKKTSPLVPIGIGVAATGVAVGSISGLVAISNKPSDSECPNNKCPPGDPQSKLHTSQTAGNVATVAWILAGVGVGVAITGFVISGKDQKQGNGTRVEPYVGLGGGGFRGSF